MIILKSLLNIALLILIGCVASPQDIASSSDDREDSNIKGNSKKLSKIPYDLERPSDAFVLDKDLKEISSLAYDESNNTFFTNDDESGKFFTLDGDNLKVKQEIKFDKKGDYESIEKIGNNIIICKSSGTLHFYDMLTQKTTIHKTKLSSKNNVEGLCYDKAHNTLLLACKGQPLIDKKTKKDKRYVYSFDLETMKLNTEPFLNIEIKTLEKFIEAQEENISKSERKKLMNRAEEFAPSGITINPVSGDYYIISARGSALVIFDEDKILKDIEFLDNKIIPQPEGICFGSNSDLYISTEGQGVSGKVFKFAAK